MSGPQWPREKYGDDGRSADEVIAMKTMKIKPEDSFLDQLVEGLEASVRYSKGTLSLSTTVLPEPPPVPKPEQVPMPDSPLAEVLVHG
ncbi:MAG: hypothetical protein HC888_12790, partial [Candidatus Competibacteraceae bacterium]|nr:hypothetical protein [Candidatus Competibacteraceae bacterium]